MADNSEVFIRTSERLSFKACRQQWWWAYVENLQPKRERPALEFGTLVHKALELYMPPGRKRRGHPAKHLSRLYRQHLDRTGEEILPVRGNPEITAEDLGVEMLTNYVDHYGPEDWMEVISPELTFQVDVFNPRTGDYLYTYVGQIDNVIRNLNTGKVGFLENKTGQPTGPPLTLNEQSGSYWAYAPAYLVEKGLISPDEEVDFVLFNRLRKDFADTRPRNEQGQYLNKNGTISKQQPLPLFTREYVWKTEKERTALMQRVRQEAREMDLVRQGKLKVYKNPDQHCMWCPFLDMCEVHESGSDWKAVRQETMERWRPYSAHEVQKERRH